MDFSSRECPQCGYLFMDFYEGEHDVRFICPDCGYEEIRDKNKLEGKVDRWGFGKKHLSNNNK